MAFSTVNNRRSALRRLKPPRLSSEGAGFDLGDRRQVRWRYRFGVTGVEEGFILHTATFTDLDTLTAEVLA